MSKISCIGRPKYLLWFRLNHGHQRSIQRRLNDHALRHSIQRRLNDHALQHSIQRRLNDRRIEEVADNIGRKTWVIPDGFLPERSNGHFVSHEAVCVLNLTDEDAHLTISVYFEDREPMTGFTATCGARRTNHVRLDKIVDSQGQKIPVGIPYALKVDSDQPVIVQHSRMDTTQAEMALMSTIAYPV